jgi:hypothetical protein
MPKFVPSGQVTGRRRLGLLPAEATSFVGRTAELSAITALLTSARLVTVTGPGGGRQDPHLPAGSRVVR